MNAKELRQELTTIFSQVKDGKLDIKVAAELNNTAGKILSTAKAQLSYAALRKEKPEIDFLDCK